MFPSSLYKCKLLKCMNSDWIQIITAIWNCSPMNIQPFPYARMPIHCFHAILNLMRYHTIFHFTFLHTMRYLLMVASLSFTINTMRAVEMFRQNPYINDHKYHVRAAYFITHSSNTSSWTPNSRTHIHFDFSFARPIILFLLYLRRSLGVNDFTFVLFFPTGELLYRNTRTFCVVYV